MPAPLAIAPKWKALPRMGYGIVTYPFRPLPDNQFANSPAAARPSSSSKREVAFASALPVANGMDIAAQQLSLDLGDEVYVFEQAEGWYRGYVVTSVTPPVVLSTSSSSSSHGPKIATEVKGLMEPKVYVGIFPANYVAVKEYVSDALGILANGDEEDEEYNSANASKRSSYLSATTNRREASASTPASPAIANFPRLPLHRLTDKLLAPKRNLSTSSRKTEKSVRTSRQTKNSAIQRTPPLPALKVGDDTEAGLEEPLVDEISAALREWHGLLFGIFLKKHYRLFDDLSGLILKLERARRDLLSGLLTKAETMQLRREIVVMLNIGNKMLPGGAVVIRNPEGEDRGQIVDGEGSISPIALMAMQASVAASTPSLDSIASPTSPPSPGKQFFALEVPTRPAPVLSHLLVNMRAFVGSISTSHHEGVELMFSLYARHEKYFISEFYRVRLNHNGVPAGPRPEDLVGRVQTLFTDLTSRDVADEIYLVCRIFRIGEAKDVLRPGTSHKDARNSVTGADLSRPSMSGTHRLQKSTSSIQRSKGSRVSQIFSRSTSPESETSPTRIPPPANANLPNGKVDGVLKGPVYRRPFGCAVLDLSKTLQENVLGLQEVGTDHIMPIFVASQDHEFYQLHDRIIESKTNKFHKAPKADSVNVNIKLFHGDRVEDVVQANPPILHAVTRTNRVGFNDATFQSRSDIFITLTRAVNAWPILRPAHSPGYVMVSAEVRLANRPDTVVEKCFFRGTGATEEAASVYESYVVGNVNELLWNERFKLCLPEDITPKALLVYKFVTMRSATGPDPSEPEPAVAFAAMNLSKEGLFTKDGEHRLKIRRIEPGTTFDQHLTNYILEETAPPVPSDATICIETFLCSTQFTEDNTLHSLLHWKQDLGQLNGEESKFKMKEILRKFTFVSEIEILKFLPEVFDALFGILVEGGTRGELDDYVYRSLVYVLVMESDRRFTNFKAKLEEYITKQFNWPFITKSMLKSAHRLLTNSSDPQAAKRLRATMKVWRALARFLVIARQQQREKEIGLEIENDHPEAIFKEDILGLFKLLQQLMRSPSGGGATGAIVGTQTLALQHFSALLPELSPVFSAEELLEIAVGFVDSCADPKGKLALYKLQLVSNLVRNSVFMADPTLERLLIFNIPRWLKPHCGKAPEFSGVDSENAKGLWREQIRLCTAIVGFALDYLWAFISGEEVDEELRSRAAEGFALLQPLMSDFQQSYLSVKEMGSTGKTPGVISPLFPTTYPFPAKPIIGNDRSFEGVDELLAELSAVLMTSAIRAEYGKVAGLFGFRPTTNSLSPLLIQSFQVYTSILSFDAFPTLWLNSHILVHKAIVNHLVTISEVMIQFYNPDPEEAESFDTGLWLAFFNVLLKTVGSDALAVEHLPPQKRRAVWRIAGDLRKRGAELLQETWAAIGWPTAEQETKGFQIERMGGYQVQYVPSLVAPVVRLCLSHHEALRSVALEVLQTMIVSEFVINEDFAILQNEIINALDATFHHKPADADAMSKTLLVQSLRVAFALPGIDEELSAKVDDLVNSVELFFELLVSAYGDSNEADVELEHILKLMEFVKGMNRRDIYLNHQLARRHRNNGHHVEAGLALKLEADLYQWNQDVQLEESVEPEHPAQSEFARKESLYVRIIDCYERGKAWEKAIELCKELAEQYETKTLDYLSLKNILQQHASFLDQILTVDRPSPSYFRVHCWGQAWPLQQRNKDWIVQGADWEKISSFSERMQLLYPTAQLVNANTMPSFETMDKGQYLQVTALVPIPGRTNPIFTTPGVSPRIRQYHEHHDVNQFSYQIIKRNNLANRHEAVDSNPESVVDLWTERRILYSEATFPNIARKANVINYATVRSSPIENAIQAIKNKNDELLELERKYEPLSLEEGDVNVNSLSLALTSVIDSPLNGGVHKYKTAFLSEAYAAQHQGNNEEMEFIEVLKGAIEHQVVLVRRCLEIHKSLVSAEMKPFHKSLIELFHKNFADELAVVRPATPRNRSRRDTNASKRHEPRRTSVAQSNKPVDLPLLIPPINIETSPTPIPESVQHAASMSRSSISSSLHPNDDPRRLSMDAGSESPVTIRSQDRRSLTSRITPSVKSIRKTLSFRGRKNGEFST